MAVICAVSVANLYYNQPLLGLMAADFHVPARQVGLIPTLTQIGYALGMLLFVPLGDRFEWRSLIAGMLGAVALALCGAALAPGVGWLAAASLLVGVTTIVPQLILPFAAGLARPEQRGRVIGAIMGGLLTGILAARTVSGFVGAHFGWRSMYWIAAAMMVLLALLSLLALPRSRPAHAHGYWELLRSLGPLVREHVVLREAALFGAMAFGAFSAFWSTLVFLLAGPPFHYGSDVAGLFGLVGIVGAAGAPIVGRLADRQAARTVVGYALVITLAAFAVFALSGRSLAGLVVGVILLDMGVQANQVANQTRIYSLAPGAHGRLNTVYMVSYFIGGSTGSLLGTFAWSVARWPGVCAAGASMVLAGLLVFRLNARRLRQV
jgi:predicted MFS family arabinose efflux permease